MGRGARWQAGARATGDAEDPGILRLDFGKPEEGLEPITLLYEDEPDNRFNKLVRR